MTLTVQKLRQKSEMRTKLTHFLLCATITAGVAATAIIQYNHFEEGFFESTVVETR
jgi:hypothetical protein